MNILKKLLLIPNLTFILLVLAYQKTFSKIVGFHCIYENSCSNYALECLRKHNIVTALILITLRLLRCNSLFKGGYESLSTEKPILNSLREFKKRLIK
ncbi:MULTISPECIES: membrane protein insertion efficiency factor YidD [unclassified Borrelia]|uniref:membrane protein insertion efficiency factor YidD n=1 Tax=unclassified Borrelia TaxID=2649934 RepID=UPI001E292C72|nr:MULTISPECIES: membrane protein insertion efficiency factor YidD [unclassified Borrelia]UGQ15844.1 membrane protein insertion efficiency factor YidD [Borrelia sp. RT5S]UGQ16954.1 membrane protein insertion efficiency factor YidD [Borrelia sp. RT1S]